MDALIIITFGFLAGAAILINPMIGMFLTVILMPQATLPQVAGGLFGIFTAATPIKIVGGITFISVFVRYIFSPEKEDLLKATQVRLYMLFLIYLYINGFSMPGFATRVNFTAFTSFAMIGFIMLVLIKDLKLFRLIVWWSVISVFFACAGAVTSAGRGRFAGTSYGPNEFGITILPFLGLSYACLLSERKTALRTIAIVVSAVIVFALLMTFSRAGLAGLGLMLMVFVLKSKKKIPIFLGLAVLLFVSAVYMPSSVWEGMEERFEETERTLEDIESAPDVDSTKRRYRMAKAAWALFLDNPVFGIGIGNYYYEFRKYESMIAGRAHSMYLEILAEMGIVGFLLFMAVIGHTLRSLNRMIMFSKEPVNYYAYGLYLGLVGFLGAAAFLHAQQVKVLWFFVFLSAVLWKISEPTIPEKSL
ncbi:MAG: O-antigen ligase family protein [Candidatus Omnitrophota bacterium]